MAPRRKTLRKRKCPHCDYTPPTRYQWQTHARTHSGERPFACPSCEWKFAQKGNRDRHVKQVHQKADRIPCSWKACSETFSNANNMRVHVRSKHLKHRFSCRFEGCTFTCSSTTSLAGHIKAVHEKVTITCPVKGCSFRSSYRQHISRHVHVKHEKKILSCS